MALEKLLALKVKRATKPGLYGDGRGLYLRVGDGNANARDPTTGRRLCVSRPQTRSAIGPWSNASDDCGTWVPGCDDPRHAQRISRLGWRLYSISTRNRRGGAGACRRRQIRDRIPTLDGDRKTSRPNAGLGGLLRWRERVIRGCDDIRTPRVVCSCYVQKGNVKGYHDNSAGSALRDSDCAN